MLVDRWKKINTWLLITLLCSVIVHAAQTQELVVALEAMPKTLDPRFAVDANGMRITQQLIYETLVQQDYNLKIVPFLASHWETPSPTKYVFHLRKDARFSNGVPFTSEDVKYTLDSIMDSKIGSPFYGVLDKSIKSITILDKHTIQFELMAPKPSFLLDLFIPIFQKAKHVDSQELIGTGPFQLERKSASELLFARNPNYYGKSPFLEKITFKVIKDDNTRFLKLKKGDIDFVLNALPVDKLKQFQRNPLKKKYKAIEFPGLNYQYLGFNVEHPILKDKRVRQAIAHAVNRDELIKFFKKGHALKADSLLIPQNEFYVEGLPQYEYNIEKAAELLDEAGYKEKNGKRFILEYKTTTSTDAVTQARIIKSHLKKVGIEVNLRTFEWGTFFEDVKTGNFHLFSLRWVGVSTPDFYYDLFHSTQFPPGRNRVRYVNKSLDKLLSDARIEGDVQKRKDIYRQVQMVLAEDLPYLSLWHNNNIVLLKKDIAGYRPHPSGGFHSFKLLQRTGS